MDPLLGEIKIWPLTWAPDGYLFCNGQLLPIAQYQALFALIGVTYGGNGTTNFALPNLNGRIPVGADTTTHLLGKTLGDPTKVAGTGTLSTTVNATGTGSATIGANNLPAHTHPATMTTAGMTATTTLTAGTGTNGGLAATTGASLTSTVAGPSGAAIYTTDPTAPVNLAGASTVLGGAGTVTVNANTGGGQPLNINLAIPVALNAVPLAVNVPTLNLNFIIAINGIFPQRP